MEIFIAVGGLGDWDFTQGFSTKGGFFLETMHHLSLSTCTTRNLTHGTIFGNGT
jgi:hypothetical protein